ncbi:hypothetical protein N657DRAFT_650834 [Parathielavia appendiculata]|uniref:Uncharacterized protein n=1 Tax=Parathielavia appendiculata TaxID=2587402 RepID=A0AAN6TQL8_9PEZI|nr:hypothetical protein N657DRAFT_650834 [Parathielavia appendiculata]
MLVKRTLAAAENTTKAKASRQVTSPQSLLFSLFFSSFFLSFLSSPSRFVFALSYSLTSTRSATLSAHTVLPSLDKTALYAAHFSIRFQHPAAWQHNSFLFSSDVFEWRLLPAPHARLPLP